MRRVGVWIILGLLNLPGGLRAESDQKTALPEASVVDSTEGNVRRIVVVFGSRRLVTEQLLDKTAPTLMQADFGENGTNSLPIVDGKSISTSTFQKGMESPTWMVDGLGNGFYLPIQPDFTLTQSQSPAVFHLQEISNAAGQDRKWGRLDFDKTTPEEMAKIAKLMSNTVLAPLQITENDEAEIIVYDLASKTTAYAISQSSERMNSAGYLSGSGQPCVVLIRVNGDEMTLSAGHKKAAEHVRLKLFGDWKADANETALISCIQKAGRTWVEFSTGPDGSAPIRLVKLPEKGYFQRIFEAIQKK